MSGDRLGLRSAITRPELEPKSVTVTTSLGSTPATDMQGYSGLSCRSPASAVTTLTLYGAMTEDGTYTAIQFGGVDVTLTLSGAKWNSTDDLIKGKFPFRWWKIVGNAGGVIDIVGVG